MAVLRGEFDAVICEGAGSPAEINLRATDLANMGLARAADLPVRDRRRHRPRRAAGAPVRDRRGAGPGDQALIAGFLVNKFRGDPALLAPGLDQLAELTGRPTYGVLPYADELWLDTEDSVSVVADAPVGAAAAAAWAASGCGWRAIRLPRISNSTDVEALACEPGVVVRWVTDPADVADADVVVLPGTKATVADLAWLRERGLDDAIVAHAAAGRPVLGICGGFQMLCRRIDDPRESGAGVSTGSGCWTPTSSSSPTRRCARHTEPLAGYEIHHGQVVRCGRTDWRSVRHPPGRGVRHALARPVRQRRLPPGLAGRGGRGRRARRIRRRRPTSMCPRAATPNWT